MTPSNSKIFLIPRTKSTFSWISDTGVNISNLCPCISIIMDIINKMLTNCPFLTQILWVLDAKLGREWNDLQCKYCDFDMNDLLAPVSSNTWHSVPSNNFPIVYPCSDIRNDSSALTLLFLIISTLPKVGCA